MEESKILLVDDDVDFCEATGKILESKSYSVITAHDGREARQQLKREKPDLIILDVMLPDQDGFSLCTEFKEMTGFFDIPILILTSMNTGDSGDKYSEMIALHHNANAYAEKPIDPKELLAKVYLLITGRKFALAGVNKRKKVLVVDCDYDFIRKLRQLLEANNFEVQVADTARGGMMMARVFSPDVILLDAMLPDRDGFTMTRELKTHVQTANIPVIMATALDKQFKEPDYARSIANTHRVDEYIAKPVEFDVLLEKIKEFA